MVGSVHGDRGMVTAGTSHRAPVPAIVGIGAQSPGRGAPRQLFSLYSINQKPTRRPLALLLPLSYSLSLSLSRSLFLRVSLYLNTK